MCRSENGARMVPPLSFSVLLGPLLSLSTLSREREEVQKKKHIWTTWNTWHPLEGEGCQGCQWKGAKGGEWHTSKDPAKSRASGKWAKRYMKKYEEGQSAELAELRRSFRSDQ